MACIKVYVLFFERVELRSKHSILACYLLDEKRKGKASRWFPYISTLPLHYDSVPLFFNARLKAMLQGSLVLQKITDRTQSLRIEYENLTHVSFLFCFFLRIQK